MVSRVDPRCSHCESLGPQRSSTSAQPPREQTSSPPASTRFACMCAALGSTVASFLLLHSCTRRTRRNRRLFLCGPPCTRWLVRQRAQAWRGAVGYTDGTNIDRKSTRLKYSHSP